MNQENQDQENKNQENKNQTNHKQEFKKIIRLVCLIIGVAGIVYLGFYFWQEKKNKDAYEEMKRQEALQKELEEQRRKEEQEEQEKQEPEEEPEPEEVNPIDFAYWKSVNPDVYAWISIADTNVDYPILQSASDDSYYLEHTIDHVKGYPGSIYTEKVNAKDFSDFNTVIYGHDMKDGSMFKHLHKFEEKAFFDSHDTVKIYTETEVKTYRIYAAVIYDNRHIMYTYDNDNVSDRAAFIRSLKTVGRSGSFFREDMTIDENSKLITMSTCITGQPDRRYIVVAAEVSAEQ